MMCWPGAKGMAPCAVGVCVVLAFGTVSAAAHEWPHISYPHDAFVDDCQPFDDGVQRSAKRTSVSQTSFEVVELISLLQTLRTKQVGKGLQEHDKQEQDVKRKYKSIALIHGQDSESSTGSTVMSKSISWPDSNLWFTRVGLIVLILAAIILFVFYVAAGSVVVDGNRSRAHYPLQTILLLYICMFMSSVTVVIPASSALMRDLGLGATSSGLFIGCAWPLSSVVAFSMKPLVQDWDQSQVRLVLLFNFALQALAALAFALASDPPTMFGTVGSTPRLIVLIISRLLVGVSGGCDLLLNVMVWKIVPAKEMVNLELNKTYCRILAIGLGPLLFSLICWATGASSPRTHLAHPAYAFSIFWFIFGIIASVFIPKEITSLIQVKEAEDNRFIPEGVNNEQHNSFNVRALSEETRKSIWFAGMFYGFERALMVSALEAATSLIIEIEFGWNVKDVGLAVSMTFFVGLPFALLLNIAREGGMISEAKLMCGAAVTSVVASVLLFPSISLARALEASGLRAAALEAHGFGTVVLVLTADCFIFTSRYLANGIIDGLAIQSSLPGTFCSMENFRLFESLLQDSLARFVGPILARYLISSHGRGAYSILQLCVSSLGCLTCLSVASKLWLPDSRSGTDKSKKEPSEAQPNQKT